MQNAPDFPAYALALSEVLIARVKALGGSSRFVRRTLPGGRMLAGLRFELPGGRAFVFSSLPGGIHIWPGTGHDRPDIAPLMEIPAGSPAEAVETQAEKILVRAGE